MPTEFEWAYLAGVIDGEGCITISIRKDRKLFSVANRVMVYNTDLELVNWVHDRFGGHLRTHIREGSNHKPDGIHEGYGSKAVYRLDWCGAESITYVLSGTVPYLVSKRQVANMLLTLLSTPAGLEEEKIKLFNSIKEVQKYG